MGWTFIRCVAVAVRTNACDSFVVRKRWLTASYQCIGFNASVLVGTAGSCSVDEPMDLADLKTTFNLVRRRFDGCRSHGYLAGDGIFYLGKSMEPWQRF